MTVRDRASTTTSVRERLFCRRTCSSTGQRVLGDNSLDPRRLVARDPKSRAGEAIRVVGYSAGMDRLLVVVLVPDGHPPAGLWHVATAWPANSRIRGLYHGRESEDG